MIRLVCPALDCRTTWVLHPEAIDERVLDVARHAIAAHGDQEPFATFRVYMLNAEAIRKAHDELREHANRRYRRPRHHSH